MKYTKEAANAASSVLESRRQQALSEYDLHIQKIKKDLPEAYEIFLDLSNTGSKLANVVFSKTVGDSPRDISAEVAKIRDENLKNQEKLANVLSAFGYPDDYLTIKYHCPDCCDTGSHDGRRCHCFEELMTSITIAKLNAQCRIKLHSFSDFDLSLYPETYSYGNSTYNAHEIMSQNLDFCLNYANSFSQSSPSLLLLGNTGLGKTFLSSCIANELIKKGVNVAFDSIQNYLRYIEDEHFGRAEGETLDALLDADLLILDDLGCEFQTSFSSSVIYNLLNSRCNMGKPTIVSSNLAMDKLKSLYDDRIISRLMGNFRTLRFIGEDIRQIKRREGIFG